LVHRCKDTGTSLTESSYFSSFSSLLSFGEEKEIYHSITDQKEAR